MDRTALPSGAAGVESRPPLFDTLGDPALVDPARTGMDIAFIVMLFMTGLTGMALLLWRDSFAMGPLLALHLGVVFSLFITLPYGKFVHGIYRYVALVRYARERRMMGHT